MMMQLCRVASSNTPHILRAFSTFPISFLCLVVCAYTRLHAQLHTLFRYYYTSSLVVYSTPSSFLIIPYLRIDF
uniref:Secreted protein n=1 Tax=Caenorhabditis tropicalis TaxID=1561998 RepID=A0A1I7TM58_9PELO